MTDAVVDAMRAGAGLPVLTPLDRYLETRALEGAQAAPESSVIEQVLEAANDWISHVEARTLERLDACDEGPLVARMRRRVRCEVEPARARTTELAEDARRGGTPWSELAALLGNLHDLRETSQKIQRAGRHLAELAELVGDIPDDEEGREALDELTALEARAGTQDDADAWVNAALELEQTALEAVRLTTTADGNDPTEPTEEVDTAPDSLEAGTGNAEDPPSTPAREPVRVLAAKTANGHRETVTLERGGTNGHRDTRSNGHAAPKQQRAVAVPATGHEANGHAPAGDPTDPATPTPAPPTTSARTGHGDAAGPDVLAEWEQTDACHEMRHGPFWTPILEGEVASPEDATDALLDHARRVEVDLVDLELPRVLAIPTGCDPAQVRQAIAERAEEITRREPSRPAREAFLDYVVGKLPQRYRETTRGLTLVGSIAHAVCTDDPWTVGGPAYDDTVRRLVAAELERTPALDLEALAASLVGESPSALETVQAAARQLAENDPDVTVHDDGVLVRAVAAREDPDALYDLRESLKRRLPDERAQTLVETLVTTRPDDKEENQ